MGWFRAREKVGLYVLLEDRLMVCFTEPVSVGI